MVKQCFFLEQNGNDINEGIDEENVLFTSNEQSRNNNSKSVTETIDINQLSEIEMSTKISFNSLPIIRRLQPPLSPPTIIDKILSVKSVPDSPPTNHPQPPLSPPTIINKISSVINVTDDPSHLSGQIATAPPSDQPPNTRMFSEEEETTTFSPLDQKIESKCIDKDNLCKFWASINQCEKNKKWMSENCAISCDKCNGNK